MARTYLNDAINASESINEFKDVLNISNSIFDELDKCVPIYSLISTIISFIIPSDTPTELLRQTFRENLSVWKSIWLALESEYVIICLITITITISLIPICSVILFVILQMRQPSDTNQQPGSNEKLSGTAGIKLFFLQVTILMMLLTIAGLFVTNENLSNELEKIPITLDKIFDGTTDIITDSHNQIVESFRDVIDNSIDDINNDLQNIGDILGKPIQKTLEKSSKIESHLNSIRKICAANSDIIHRIQQLQDSVARAILISHEAFIRIEEIQVQLSVLQQQCTGRERPLCETLKLKSFMDNNLLDTLIKIQNEQSFTKMLHLGLYISENNTLRNLSTEMEHIQSTFFNYPEFLKQNNLNNIKDINKALNKLSDSAELAEDLFTTSIENINNEMDKFKLKTTKTTSIIEDFRPILWLIILITTILVLVATLSLFLIPVSRSCNPLLNTPTNGNRTLLFISTTTISLCTLGLMLFTIFFMIIGVHCEIFFCRPLNESPTFSVLTKLIDKPSGMGMAQHNNTPDGDHIVGMLRHNVTTLSQQLPFNGSLGTVIEDCKNNHTMFEVFELERIINVSDIINLNKYPDIVEAIEELSAIKFPFIDITGPLQTILEDMFIKSNVNLTLYRLRTSQPTPEKDMAMFIDQLQRVTTQIHDISTSSRMITLSNRARRLQYTLLKPIEDRRTDIIFHLTALELQLKPWTTQINQSILQLKTSQIFLNEEATIVCLNFTHKYKERLKSHITNNRGTLINNLLTQIASCQPLFDVFNAFRVFTCNHIVDAINRLWFLSWFCIVFWSIIIPILFTFYGIKDNQPNRTCDRELSTEAATYEVEESCLNTGDISQQTIWHTSRLSPDIDRTNW